MEEAQLDKEMFLNHFKRLVLEHPGNDVVLGENEYGHSLRLTYKDLDDKSNQLAHYLISLGLKAPLMADQYKVAEPIIALVFDKSNPDWVVSFLAIWKAGCAVLLIGRELTKEEAVYRIQNVKASAIITDFTVAEDIDFLKDDQRKNCFGLNHPDIQKHPCTPIANVNVTLDHLAYIAYTSGTTGDSKAIAINHRGIMPITLAHKKILETKLGEKILQYAKFSFDASYMELLMIGVGVTLVLESASEGTRKEPGHYIKKYKIDMGIFVPSVLNRLDSSQLISLRAIISTGEAGNDVLFKRWCCEGRSRIVVNGYGPAECTIGVTLSKYIEGEITLGTAIQGTKVVLLEKKENKEALPSSHATVGKNEIGIAGDAVGRGYIKDGEICTETTDKAFVTINRERIYRTGDLGHFNKDGQLVCDGRKDRQFKIFGMRVEAQAIEEVLRNVLCLNGIDVAVVPRYRGKTDKIIKWLEAFILIDDRSLITMDIKMIRREMMKSRLFKAAVPVKFYAIKKDKDFYNEKSDKLKYKKLSEMLDDEAFLYNAALPFCKQGIDINSQGLTETEKKIEELWREMLPISEDLAIDIEKDEFCHWGGNSMQEVELMKKLEEKFKINFKEYPVFKKLLTIKNLACDIARRLAYGKECWKRIDISGDPLKPPIFIFHSILGIKEEFDALSDKLSDDQIIYVLRDPLTLSEEDESEQFVDYKNKYKCETIEEIVSYAIHGMLKNNPGKHCFIGGFSFGGVLACEAASQLQSIKREITWLGLIEPPIPRELAASLQGKESGVKKVRQIIKNCLNTLALAYKFKNITLDGNDLHRVPEEKLVILFDRAKSEFQELNPDFYSAEADKIKKLLLLLVCIERNLRALVRYNPPKYTFVAGASFLYFCPENNDGSYKKKWKNCFVSSVEMRDEISCKHIEMLGNEPLQEMLRNDVKARLGSLSSSSYLDHLSSFKTWHIPDAYPHFVGRKNELEDLRGYFENPEIMTVAICGFGGLGKSRLVQIFAEECIAQKRYEIVAWFKVDESLHKSIQDFLYEKFKIRHDNSVTLKTLIELFYQKLSQLNSALIIFDGATKAEELRDFIKDDRSNPIKVLVTSRENDWPKGYVVKDMGVIKRTDAVNFIKKHIESKEDKIEKLAEYLDFYPLALQQAVGFLSSHPVMPVEEYIRLLESCGTQVLDEMGAIIDKQYQKTLVSIVVASLKSLDDQRNKKCKEFLIQLSMLDHEGVPDVVLRHIFFSSFIASSEKELGTNLQGKVDKSNISYDSVMNALKKIGLISWDGNIFKMHTVIQHVVLGLTQSEEKRRLVVSSLGSLYLIHGVYDSTDQKSEYLYQYMCQSMIKMFTLYLDLAEDYVSETDVFAFNLFSGLLGFLAFTHNDKLWEIGVELSEKFLQKRSIKKTHPLDYMSVIADYTQMLRKIGQRERAVEIFFLEFERFDTLMRQGLARCTKDNFNVIKSRALDYDIEPTLRKKILGELLQDSPECGALLHCLGQLFEEEFNYTAAYECYKKACDAKTKKFGENNFQYAVSLHSLASVAAILGRLCEAKKAIIKSLKIKQEWFLFCSNEKIEVTISESLVIHIRCGDFFEVLAFQDKCPNSAYKVKLYYSLALYEKAGALISFLQNEFLQARAGYAETVFSTNDIVLSIYKGKLLALIGNYQESENLLRTTIIKCNEMHRNAPYHNTLVAKLELIYVLCQQKKYQEALALAIEVTSESLSDTAYKTIAHPIPAKAYYYLGIIFLEQKQLSLARQFFMTAFGIQSEVYKGLTHPDLAETFRELASLEIMESNFERAHKNLQKALFLQFRAYGQAPHPEIAKTYLVFSQLAYAQKNMQLALEQQQLAEKFVKVELIDPAVVKLVEGNKRILEDSKPFFGDLRSAPILMFLPADYDGEDNHQENQQHLKPSSPKFNNNKK